MIVAGTGSRLFTCRHRRREAAAKPERRTGTADRRAKAEPARGALPPLAPTLEDLVHDGKPAPAAVRPAVRAAAAARAFAAGNGYLTGQIIDRAL